MLHTSEKLYYAWSQRDPLHTTAQPGWIKSEGANKWIEVEEAARVENTPDVHDRNRNVTDNQQLNVRGQLSHVPSISPCMAPLSSGVWSPSPLSEDNSIGKRMYLKHRNTLVWSPAAEVTTFWVYKQKKGKDCKHTHIHFGCTMHAHL